MDEKLIKAIKEMAEGKESGFNTVYSETYNHVFFRAKQHMNNDEDAQDLTQIVFIEAFKNIGSLQTPEAIYGWLDRITYNQGMKLFRKKKEVLLSEEGEGVFDTLESNDIESMPELSMDQKETSKIIREIIDELPEAQKVALIAYYFDHFSVGQIAEMEECSEGTIKSRLNYARKYLKDRIEEKEKKEGYKLHAFALPLLWWAIKFMADDTTMSVEAAQMVYNGACSGVGLQASTITVSNAAASKMASGVKATKAGMASNSVKTTAGIGAKFATLSGGTKALIIAGALAITGAGIGGAIYSANTASNEMVDEAQQIEDNSSETIIEADLSPYITISDYIEYYDNNGERYTKITKSVHPQKQEANTYIVTKEVLANLVNDGEMIYVTWNIPKGIVIKSFIVPILNPDGSIDHFDESDGINYADESVCGLCPNITVKEDIIIEFALEYGIKESDINYEKTLSEIEKTNSNNIEDAKTTFSDAEKNQLGIAICYAQNNDFLSKKDNYVFNTRLYIDSVLNGRSYEQGLLPLGWNSNFVSEETVKTFWKDGFGIDIPDGYAYQDSPFWGNVSCDSEPCWDRSLERLTVKELNVIDNTDGTYTISGIILYGEIFDSSTEGDIEETFSAVCELSGNTDVFGGYRIISFDKSTASSVEVDFDDIAKKYAEIAGGADPYAEFYIDDINSDGIPEFIMPTPYASEAEKEFLIYSYNPTNHSAYYYGATGAGHAVKLFSYVNNNHLIVELIHMGYDEAYDADPINGSFDSIYSYAYPTEAYGNLKPTFVAGDEAYEIPSFADGSINGIKKELKRFQ